MMSAVCLAVGLAPSARADVITFDPDGAGPDPAMQITGFDWAVGNALAKSSLPLTVGETFQLYYQAALGGLINTNGITVVPAGLNTTYQITAVASITEVVTSVGSNPNTATFALAPVQNNSFLEIWTNPAVVADNFQGTGFNVGTKILSATPTSSLASSGNFTLAQAPGGGLIFDTFDKVNPAHYPGITTVVGSGSALIGSVVNSQNNSYFLTTVTQGSTAFNTSNKTPFDTVEPSLQFVGLPNGVAPNIIPVIGTINGVNGTDFQFQADANESFAVATPEPTSVTLLGMGLAAGFLGRGWLRRKRSA
jgi:hypothetical protein